MAVKEDQSPEMIGVVFRTVRAVVLDGAKYNNGQVDNKNVATTTEEGPRTGTCVRSFRTLVDPAH